MSLHDEQIVENAAAEDLALVLAGEYAQVAAAVLSGLEAEKASRVLTLLPYAARADILRRIVAMRPVSRQGLREVLHVLAERLRDRRGAREPRGGAAVAAAIARELDAANRQELLAEIEEAAPPLHEELLAALLAFDELALLEDEHFAALFRAVAPETWPLALLGAPEALRARVVPLLDAARRGALQGLEAELESGAAVGGAALRLADVAQAREEVMNQARRLLL